MFTESEKNTLRLRIDIMKDKMFVFVMVLLKNGSTNLKIIRI